jgi:hypothetical protein
VARWDFDENGGLVVADRSGVDPALDLTISEAGAGVTWLAGALRVDADSVLTTAGPATKVIDAVLASNELTVEAWVVPANLTQAGPARILTCSQNTSLRNFQVAQEAAVFNGRFRTTTTGLNGGIPELEGGTVVLALTQVTMTRNAAGERRLYVNGVQVAMDAVGGGLSTWDPSFAIAVANEHTRDRDWLGELHLIAIYGRALSGAELQQNFSVGP